MDWQPNATLKMTRFRLLSIILHSSTLDPQSVNSYSSIAAKKRWYMVGIFVFFLKTDAWIFSISRCRSHSYELYLISRGEVTGIVDYSANAEALRSRAQPMTVFANLRTVVCRFDEGDNGYMSPPYFDASDTCREVSPSCVYRWLH
jgi:hypothetical protein